MATPVDVLVPTYGRPAALAVTLACLVGQRHQDFRVVVSDQTDGALGIRAREVQSVVHVLRSAGHDVVLLEHVPRRGLAEQRHFLLEQAVAPHVLYLDDDVIVEPTLLERLVTALERERCGFVGSFVNAPSAVSSAKPVDEPPVDLGIEFWDGRVRPEVVRPDTPAWDRHRLHFAAYLVRLQRRLGLDDADRLYRVAWVGGCVLFDRSKLVEAGGFSFWEDLPSTHAGEDVLAQLRVMARFGGAGLFPSGAWHQEVPTTCPDRQVDAPRVLETPGAGLSDAGLATRRR